MVQSMEALDSVIRASLRMDASVSTQKERRLAKLIRSIESCAGFGNSIDHFEPRMPKGIVSSDRDDGVLWSRGGKESRGC